MKPHDEREVPGPAAEDVSGRARNAELSRSDAPKGEGAVSNFNLLQLRLGMWITRNAMERMQRQRPSAGVH